MHMHNWLVIVYVILLSAPGILSADRLQSLAWTHHAALDRAGVFLLLWIPAEDEIIFEIQAQTHGYLGLGFSPSGGMRGADLVIGWVTENGTAVLQDRHSLDVARPILDSSQDYNLHGGYENETHTVLRFSRPWDTWKVFMGRYTLLNADTTRVLWTYHPEKPSSENALHYHGHGRRGVRSLYLKEQPHTKINPNEDHIKTWDLRADNTILPNDDHTHYWCRIFKAPQMDRKHHIIGFAPIIEPGHEAYLHHMVLYECHVPNEASAEPWFAHHVEARGEKCYSPNMPPEWTFCLATNTLAWAVGSEGETLPPHAGIPLGERSGGATFFMLETHYDNPALHKGIIDNSGIRIFYTDQLRQHDTGMLLLGSEVNFLQVIPPKQRSFKSVGRCTSSCTESGISPGGIRILNGILHSHLAGRGLRLRHVRDGKELPTILEDNHYDFNFQASREPSPQETLVLPGDELMLECEYSTIGRDSPTFGGLSTRKEMCLAFVLYYPRKKLADCRSLPTLQTVMKAFGIEAVYGQGFEKLAAFLQDIGGSEHTSGSSLHELLSILAQETGRDLKQLAYSAGNFIDRPPLTEQDLLNRPFYTVDDGSASEPKYPVSTSTSELPMTDSDYRNIISDMLLSLRIRAPEDAQNLTIAERLAGMDWLNESLSRRVENALVYGQHSTLCLAHGRDPIRPYEPVAYPNFIPLTPSASQGNKCPSHKMGSYLLKSDQSSGSEKSRLDFWSILLLAVLSYAL